MLQESPMYSYLPAKDVARARAFYEQKLGFRPVDEVAGGVVYEFAGGTSCFLYPTGNAGTNRASQAFWMVSDVEREVAELKARGVTFEEYLQTAILYAIRQLNYSLQPVQRVRLNAWLSVLYSLFRERRPAPPS